MGFFSGIRRRIKKLIPKEVRPAIPFIAAAALPGIPGLGAISNPFTKAALAKMATDDEADIRDAVRTGIIAAAPAAISKGVTTAASGDNALASFLNKSRAVEGGTSTIARGIESAANPESFMGQAKLVGSQAATDFGIKQAELNQKAIEEYERDLLKKGIRDKTARRSAIFDIFVNAGYDDDEVNVMLDKYGYADGGEVKKMQKASMTGFGEGLSEHYKKLLEKRKRKAKAAGGRVDFARGDRVMKKEFADVFAQLIKPVEFGGSGMSTEDAMEFINTKFPEEFKEGEFSESLMQGVQGLESAFGQPLGGRRPEPMRIIPGFAQGGDVDILETEEEIITPEYLMKEEGVPIGEQVSNPSKMDSLNELSLMLFNKPIFELTEEQFEMLKEFASDRAAMQVSYEPGKYSDDEIEMYENYKYNMNEQMPGMPIIDIDEFLRMEYGQGRLGVAKGGVIKKKKIISIGTGKLKDYPGIKKILEMNKKGKKRFSKANGGSSYSFKDYLKEREMLEKRGNMERLRKEYKEDMRRKKVKEQKTMAKDGGLMSLGGNELDLRGGGFVPMGKKEKADDVPARLSKNEFVFTADAVRAAGGGSVQKGADLMYDTMKKLEAQS